MDGLGGKTVPQRPSLVSSGARCFPDRSPMVSRTSVTNPNLENVKLLVLEQN